MNMNDKHNPSRKFSLTEILTAEYPLSIDCMNAIEKLVSPWERQAGDNISVKGKINDKWIFISTGLCRVYTTKKNKEDTIFLAEPATSSLLSTLFSCRKNLFWAFKLFQTAVDGL